MIEVRRARSADEGAIKKLIPRLVDFGPPQWRSPAEMTETDIFVIVSALKADSDDPIIFVAESTDDNSVVGFLHAHSTQDYYRRRMQGHVSDIVVAPGHEGHGIGKRLLAHAEIWARDRGFDWLSISVFDANQRAVELYEKVGFGRDIVRLIKPLK